MAAGRAAVRPLIGDLREQITKMNQTIKIMSWQKIIDIGQGCLHADSQRPIVWRTQQGIEPDQAVTTMLQSIHFSLQCSRFAPIPAIANDQHDGPASQYAPRPGVIK